MFFIHFKDFFCLKLGQNPLKTYICSLNFIDMKELIEKINAEFEAFSTEANQQAEKGNKAAGTRARKAALELSKLFKEFRKVSVEESKK